MLHNKVIYLHILNRNTQPYSNRSYIFNLPQKHLVEALFNIYINFSSNSSKESMKKRQKRRKHLPGKQRISFHYRTIDNHLTVYIYTAVLHHTYNKSDYVMYDFQ